MPDRPEGQPPGSGRGARHAPEWLHGVLAELCSSAGLDPTGAELLRLVNNGVFRLTSDPVVVRIVLTPSLAHRAQNAVRAATWLADHGVPAVRLLPGVHQPMQVGEYLATLWRAVPDVGPQPTTADLARLLRQVHAVPPPPFEIQEWRPLDDVRRRLADAEELSTEDREFFLQRCAAIDRALREVDFALPTSLIHGDAHLGNVIAGPDGPVLCDFDSSCVGPPEWDLTPLAVGQLRFGHPPQRYREFVDSYGFDLTAWEGFEVLRDIRELKLTAAVLPVLRSNPEVRSEFAHRLRTFRDGDRSARWSPHR